MCVANSETTTRQVLKHRDVAIIKKKVKQIKAYHSIVR